jgi:AcrR family transcriptional regulator
VPTPSTYHHRIAQEKRAAILRAALGSFLAGGYERTSLASIAVAAGVSRATLFKQFPTKAELFDAIVADYWHDDAEAVAPPRVGGLRAGLVVLGSRYVDLLTRDGMVDLYRVVIAETPRFPELGRANFERGKLPFWRSVRDHLLTETRAGSARVDDADLAATQFLGMIADYAFWPRLLVPQWNPSAAQLDHAVDQAAVVMAARYATPDGAVPPTGSPGSSTETT